MIDKVYVTAQFFFRAKNSAMYGGDGSVGYVTAKLEGIGNVERLFNPEAIQEQINAVANLLKVTPRNVELITKDEYDQETAEENDKNEEEDWEEEWE